VYEDPFDGKDLTLATVDKQQHLQYHTYFMNFQLFMPQQSTIRCEFPFVSNSYLLSHHMCGYVIRHIQGEQEFSCKFQLEPPSKPLLLDSPVSSTDEWCNVEGNNDKYINPIDLWIEEACNRPSEPWHFFDFLLQDEDSITDLVQSMKKVPICAFYKFDISLFFLATKHKGKTQGNDEFICWLHWLYDFT
jgi:hypothetical protein